MPEVFERKGASCQKSMKEKDIMPEVYESKGTLCQKSVKEKGHYARSL